jgi:hypothetical protein
MRNFDKWQFMMSGCTSPQNFIDWGFYYLIAAALQRRVWFGPKHMKLYPNMYCILVADAGVGKGLVVKQVRKILNYHLLPIPGMKKNVIPNLTSQEDKDLVEHLQRDNYEKAKKARGGKEDDTSEKLLLIPVAAEATTYEALVLALSKAIRYINYTEIDPVTKRERQRPYMHSTLCFCLEEISSLFKRHSENVVNFLLQTYDCGDYEYDTKTQGRDVVKNSCVNLFGGTTPAFMQDSFNDKILNEGFASRTFYIFAAQNRKTAFMIPELNEEQEAAYKAILQHVEKLTHLYGGVTIDKETEQFLEDWWLEAQTNRPNPSIKLNTYYSRKQIHVVKVAMALHFGESLEMHIPKETFVRAMKVLAEEEKTMHYALGLDNANPLVKPARLIVQFIKNAGAQTKKALYTEFWDKLPTGNISDVEEILEYLKASGEVKSVDGKSKVGEVITLYDIVKKSNI